ncbi:hypothetical protein [Sebaldella sp. S0638]|nr:hypothetical protein [Sebaldella sp. S0638]
MEKLKKIVDLRTPLTEKEKEEYFSKLVSEINSKGTGEKKN